jgi:hypothetical protein
MLRKMPDSIGRCPPYALACHARSEATRCDLSPEGAKVCSHGWSAAQPVETSGNHFAPAGAKEGSSHKSATSYGQHPPPLRGGRVRSLLSTGYARPPVAGLASPVATILRPAGADSHAPNQPSSIVPARGGGSPSPCTQGEGRGEGSAAWGSSVGRTRGDPHPNPLPEYMERGPERRAQCVGACDESP